MPPFGLLRVCLVAAVAAGSVGVAMPAAANNRCHVGYSATGVVFTSCAAEERACEARGFIYGTTEHAGCVDALAGGQGMPMRRTLGFRPVATPPAGMRQPPRPATPLIAPPVAPPVATTPAAPRVVAAPPPVSSIPASPTPGR